jgi:hypothetical protein
VFDYNRRNILHHLLTVEFNLIIVPEFLLTFNFDLSDLLLSFQVCFFNFSLPIIFFFGQLFHRFTVSLLKLHDFAFDKTLLFYVNLSCHALFYYVFASCNQLRSRCWGSSFLHLLDRIEPFKIDIFSKALGTKLRFCDQFIKVGHA